MCVALFHFAAVSQDDQHGEVQPEDSKSAEKNTDKGAVDSDPEDLSDLSLEELMQIEVTSVTRGKGQDLFTAPAAIYVVKNEDIRRTGHLHLAETLRLVPGMHVARLGAGIWNAAARGFNDRFNSFQLVQMDGRTLYTPVFTGVLWDVQDTVLEDLDRIEVIRGPGASLWGANAVNGIVNIHSKSASKTQGLLVSGGGGSEERGFGTLRFGGKAAKNLYFRVYGKHVEHDHFKPFGVDHTDDWNRSQGGFRFDWEGDGRDQVTWQGDVYQARVGAVIRSPDFTLGTDLDLDGDMEGKGWNFLARWKHKFSDTNETQLQIYHDRAAVSLPTGYHQDVMIHDLDFQHSIAVGKRQEIVWGLGYRVDDADFENDSGFVYSPTGRVHHTVSAFFQDAITVIENKLKITLGAKVEHNPISNFEYQPSFRLAYTPNRKHTLWWAASRAMRVPSITDEDLTITFAAAPGLPFPVHPKRSLKSEETLAFEFGYRTRPVDWFSLDLAAFHNIHEDIIEADRVSAFPPEAQFLNVNKARTYGLELATHWQFNKRLRMSANYTWLDVQVTGYSDDQDDEHSTPANQFHVRTYFDVTRDIELNGALYYYDTVPGQNVDAFWRADLGVTWRPPVDNLEVSVWGTNLFDKQHKEYGPDPFLNRAGSLIQRGIYGKVKWKF